MGNNTIFIELKCDSVEGPFHAGWMGRRVGSRQTKALAVIGRLMALCSITTVHSTVDEC